MFLQKYSDGCLTRFESDWVPLLMSAGACYTVLCAANAREAQDIAQGHEGHIDLLLTDVVMPDQNGRELYEAMTANQAGLKVLYMSGYTDNAIVHHGVLEEKTPFLQKPFEREDLAAKVRQALEG